MKDDNTKMIEEDPEYGRVNHRGVFTMTTKLLGQLLMLPPDVIITGFRVDDDNFRCNTLSVMLEGPGLPEVHEGALSPNVQIGHNIKFIY